MVEGILEAGKQRLAGDAVRAATSDEIKGLRKEAHDLKEALAEQMLENRLLKKAYSPMGSTKNEIPCECYAFMGMNKVSSTNAAFPKI